MQVKYLKMKTNNKITNICKYRSKNKSIVEETNLIRIMAECSNKALIGARLRIFLTINMFIKMNCQRISNIQLDYLYKTNSNCMDLPKKSQSEKMKTKRSLMCLK